MFKNGDTSWMGATVALQNYLTTIYWAPTVPGSRDTEVTKIAQAKSVLIFYCI